MAYATLADVRAEGLLVADASDLRVTALLDEASAFIDEVCGQFFAARSLTLTLDGPPRPSSFSTVRPAARLFWTTTTPRRDSVLHLPVPALAVTSIRRLYPGTGATPTTLAATSYTVYNRTFPDDRKNPKIVLLTGAWEPGEQIYEITGTFGYCDVTLGPAPTYTPSYSTPAPIKLAAIKLVCRRALLEADPDALYERRRGSVSSVSVQGRSQSWDLSGQTGAGTFSGDHEIDAILARFRRPMGVLPV